MKTTEQKRAELLALLKGEKDITQLTMENVNTLTVRGTVDSPEYRVGSRKVEAAEYAKCYDWVYQHCKHFTIDWSNEGKLDMITCVTSVNFTH